MTSVLLLAGVCGYTTQITARILHNHGTWVTDSRTGKVFRLRVRVAGLTFDSRGVAKVLRVMQTPALVRHIQVICSWRKNCLLMYVKQ